MPQTRKRKKDGARAAKRRPTAESKPTPRLEDRTRTELYEMAHRLDIAGSPAMSKSELVEAIRRR